ncbi:MAG: phenylalanine--tRNA ligase subunit beta, partial [Candidatus Micrarchaeota archaeon]
VYPNLEPRKMKMSLKKMNKLLGSKFSSSEVHELLGKMGYGVKEGAKGALEVFVPAYRMDVMHWVDVAEDIAVAFDYNKFTPMLPNFFSAGKVREEQESKLRALMVGMNFNEGVSWTLTNEKKNFSMMLLEQSACVEMKNALTEEFTLLRTWLTPSLLDSLKNSRQAEMPQRIFELDAVTDAHAKSKRKLAGAVIGARTTFAEIRGVLETLLGELGIDYSIERAEHPSFIKGRCARVKKDGKEMGILGEIHPQVLNNFELEQPTAVFEIEV